MITPSSVLRFLGIFVAIFFVLNLPQLQLLEAYRKFFSSVGTMVFTRETGAREVIFIPTRVAHLKSVTARIEIANRRHMSIDGSGPVRHLDFDLQRLAWTPTTLLIALILATPIAGKRKLFALAGGLLALQAVLMACLSLAILRESSEIGLVSLSPFWKSTISTFQMNVLSTITIAAPLAIWVIATFRNQTR